ncbi:hypothetical protein ACJMK2_027704 [Sinanodonta woodiana]|uniref:Inner centromere protein n=1 Tax=Sinanodonta woodiana TaxID=1069815 RepID=A0ABD3X8Q4_SINWO
MADSTFTIGFQTGQTIRLMVEDIFQRLEEDAFSYLNEILVVAKKTFKSSKIEVLPKTPGAKQSRRKVARHRTEEINENDEDNDPAAKGLSLQPEADDSRDDFASPRKQARVTRAAVRAATTSQAKRKRSQDSKEQTNPSKKNRSSPIVCIEKLVQQETLELEKRVTTENNNSCFSPVQKQSKQSYSSQKPLQNICLNNVKAKVHAYEDVIHLHENDNHNNGNQSHGAYAASPSRGLEGKTDRRSSRSSGSVRRSNGNISHLDTSKARRRSSRAGVRKSLKMLKSHQALKKNEKLEKILTSDEEKVKDEDCNVDAVSDNESLDDNDVVPISPSPHALKIIHPASFLNKLNRNNTNRILRPANVVTTIVRSFIQRNTPSKPTMTDLQDKKKKAIEEKDRLHEERLKKREMQYQMKMEELKRKREERTKKAEKQREKQNAEENKHRILLNKKMQQKEQLLESLREERLREEKEKQKIRQQKLQEAEERRLQEQKEWEKKIQEQQEEERRHQELLQKRKEIEEFERQKKVQEESQKMKDKLAEFEREREAEAEKLRQIEEEKEREWQKKKEEREKMLTQERTEKERTELEKKREKELQMKKELEKQKELEKKRFEEEEQEKEKEKHREEDFKKLLNKHNVQLIQQQQGAVTQSIPKPNLNEMLTESQIPSSNPSINLKTALINQHYHPPNLEKMFPSIEPPDLNVFFEKKRPRFNKRTSSAHWDSPILPPY